MTTITKFTSDGRKVVVLGRLNSDQHIVQEVFIIGGQEVPSGENFVVSSLHDAPAESHKEKRLRELEQRAERVERDCEDRIKAAKKRASDAVAAATLRADALLAFAKNGDNEQIELLRDWLSGKITHIFIDGTRPSIVEYDDEVLYQHDYYQRYEALKLVSVFGRSNGSLSFRLCEYSDGSGGWTNIYPARSYHDALAIAQKSLEEYAAAYVAGKRSWFDLAQWLTIEGLTIPADAAELHAKNLEAAKQSKIKKLRQELAALESAN